MNGNQLCLGKVNTAEVWSKFCFFDISMFIYLGYIPLLWSWGEVGIKLNFFENPRYLNKNFGNDYNVALLHDMTTFFLSLVFL